MTLADEWRVSSVAPHDACLNFSISTYWLLKQFSIGCQLANVLYVAFVWFAKTYQTVSLDADVGNTLTPRTYMHSRRYMLS